MRRNTLRQLWQQQEAAVCAWLSISSSYSAEIIAHSGYDAVVVDLQHGMLGIDAAIPMIQAISTSHAIPMARVSKNDPALIMSLLDAGVYGVICPMISSAQDAAAFVAACRYPPLGNRSFGPARGLLYGGMDYFQHANTEILTFAMIESVEGLDKVQEIAAVPGLDGLYIGPNDLALALGKLPGCEHDDADVMNAIATIRYAAHSNGLVAGIFCASGDLAARRIAEGFALVTPGNDASLLRAAAQNALKSARA